MQRFLVIALVVVALVMVFVVPASADDPTTCPCGLGPGQMNGRGPGAGTGSGAGGEQRGGQPEWAGHEEAIETLLGMTEAQIQAERQAGQSLVQIAATKGVTEQQLISAILAAKKADLDRLVAAGKLTQDRADFMLERMQAQVKVSVNRTTVGPAANRGQGQGQGQGQGMGPRQGQPQAPQGQPQGPASRNGRMGGGPRWTTP